MFNCGVTVFGGNNDKFLFTDEIVKWKECSNGKFENYIFKGGHFFIWDNASKITDIINRTLRGY